MTIKELLTKLDGLPYDLPVYVLAEGDDGLVRHVEASEANEVTIRTSYFAPPSAFPETRERGGPQNVAPLNIVSKDVRALVIQ